MTLTIIALSLVTSPILVMIFFAFYKTYLMIFNKKINELVAVTDDYSISVDTDDDEIIAVISAAVSTLLK
jgi:hypothetical protein